jgi:hypothetical protein
MEVVTFQVGFTLSVPQNFIIVSCVIQTIVVKRFENIWLEAIASLVSGEVRIAR